MDEYIKRNEAEERLFQRAEIANSAYIDQTPYQIMMLAQNVVHLIPAADVRPVVHGHWVYEEPNGANSFKGAYWCDQCHQPESYRKNFCPNCGTDMREVT